MSWETTLSALGISAGAALMAVSIARFGGLMGRASYIRDGDERSVLLRYLGVHRILMVFFLVGYLVVLTGIVTGIHGTFGGQLFVALIFLCGAIFVFVSKPSVASSVRVRWCGVTSQVTLIPRRLASLTISRVPAVLMCAK